jgi:subtilisin family serine protease
LACKFMDNSGVGYASGAVECIKYCAFSGARVIQASWSSRGYSAAMIDAIRYAAGRNSLFVCSAGNRNTNLDITPIYPPSYKLPSMVVVAASG